MSLTRSLLSQGSKKNQSKEDKYENKITFAYVFP